LSEASRHGKDKASGPGEIIRPGALFHGLIQEFASGNAVHAYLFTGPRGVGKKTLANLCARTILCTGANKPCGICPQCVRFLDGAHPDVLRIPGEKTIGVDLIREAVRLTGEHTYEGGRRVILIQRAEKMTAQAQNCLLKTLEEPVGETVFFLITEDASALLPTIVSRCRVKPVPPWTQEEMEPLLREGGVPAERTQELVLLSGGSIGLALQMWKEPRYGELRANILKTVFSMQGPGDVFPISSAMKDEKDQAEDFLNTLENLLRMVLLVRLKQYGIQALDDFPPRWRQAGETAPINSLGRMIEAVFAARRLKASQVSWQAVVEELLLKITEEFGTWQQ
jgi:DNA polymerase-3 subunit delta'